MSGIAIECIVTAPAGLIYIIYLWQSTPIISRFEYEYILPLFLSAVTAVHLFYSQRVLVAFHYH